MRPTGRTSPAPLPARRFGAVRRTVPRSTTWPGAAPSWSTWHRAAASSTRPFSAAPSPAWRRAPPRSSARGELLDALFEGVPHELRLVVQPQLAERVLHVVL